MIFYILFCLLLDAQSKTSKHANGFVAYCTTAFLMNQCGDRQPMGTAPKDMHLHTLLHTGKPSDHIPMNPQCATCTNYTLHTPQPFSMCHYHTRCALHCLNLIAHDPPFLNAPHPSWTCPQPCSTLPDESRRELMCHVTHQCAPASLMCPCPSQRTGWIAHCVHEKHPARPCISTCTNKAWDGAAHAEPT